MNQLLNRTLRKILMSQIFSLVLGFIIFNYNNAAIAQALTVSDLDPGAFPTIKAKFVATDKNGKQIRNLAPGDFTIKEDGLARKVTSVSCPQEKEPVVLSSVLVFDISGSMIEGPPRIQSAKDAGIAWIDGMPQNSECAIVSFSNLSTLVCDFTKDRQKLKNSISTLKALHGTNYDQALIDEPSGGLQIAKTGKYKRVLIFLTDGIPNFEPRTQDIIDFANNNNVTVYGVILDMKAPQCVKEITEKTGGLYFENIKTKESAVEIYKQLLQISQNIEPCSIEWESKPRCDSGDVSVDISLNGITKTISYISPQTSIASLRFSPNMVICRNKPVGVPFDTTITIISAKTDVNVTNVISSNPAFVITPKNFVLKADRSMTLNLRFTPIDSSYAYAEFICENDICPVKFYAAGKYNGKKQSSSTLRITHPNGGEVFCVGSDTVITWEGVLPTDPVQIEFSNDNGKTWKVLTNQTTGLLYKWKNLSAPASNECLVRISLNDSSARVPEIEWTRCLGGTAVDQAWSVAWTTDGGYIIACSAESYDGEATGNHGMTDVCIVKLDKSGVVQWHKIYGGQDMDYPWSVIETSDGGYMTAGCTFSNDGDVSGNHGGQGDAWIVKLDQSGDIQWQKCLGGSARDDARSIIETSDGGYIVACNSESKDGDVNGNIGNLDYWIVKLDQTGNIQWQKCYGGSDSEEATSIIETMDGRYVVAGSTISSDGDVTGTHGSQDYWIIKLDNSGQLLWEKCLGGSFYEEASSVFETDDGGFVISGSSTSDDGNVTGNHNGGDYWIVKLNQSGQMQWQKCLGSSGLEEAYSVAETMDGGYIVAGATNSYLSDPDNGDVSGNHGFKSSDCWIVKLDKIGQLEWQKCFGGRDREHAYSLKETTDGGFVIAGDAESSDGDLTGIHGEWNEYDGWIIKLSPEGIEQQDVSNNVFSIVMPGASSRDVDMKECLAGSAKDSVIQGFIINTGSYRCGIDSIYFEGADAQSFSLVSGLPPYDVQAGSSYSAEFQFRPSRIGAHQAQIVIITQNDTLLQNIRGEGVQPQVAVVSNLVDFGTIGIYSVKDTTVAIIKNISGTPVSFTGAYLLGPDKEQFELMNSTGIFTLQANELKKVDLRFKAKSIGRTSGQLAFDFNGVGSPAVVNMFGRATGGKVICTKDSGYAGDRKIFPLILENAMPSAFQNLTARFKSTIRFQGTILAPDDINLVKTYSGDSAILEINGSLGQTDTLAKIELTAGLGNVEKTSLDILDFKWLDEHGNETDYDIDKENGSFTLLGICREGGTRLVNPNGQEFLEYIYPNPSIDEITINYEIPEKSYVHIYITNILGERVKNIFSDNAPETGEQTIKADLSALSSGTYFIILETLNRCQSERIEIIR